MSVAVLTESVISAEEIQYPNADEAYQLLQTAFNRFLGLLESLDPEDWHKPTACTAWNVHNMVAHQAGGYASGIGYREMFRQYIPALIPGKLPEDMINARQVQERATASPATLIAELKQVGSQAMHNWAYGFRAIKWVALPHPIGGFLSMRDLMWVTHSRDTWMHRLDICRATGRPFQHWILISLFPGAFRMRKRCSKQRSLGITRLSPIVSKICSCCINSFSPARCR